MTVTLQALAADLAAGRVTSEALVEESLARIADPALEGARAFVTVHAETARAAARAQDMLRGAGLAATPYAGIPVSIKDLFDEAGHVTTAGSVVLADRAPAAADAPAIARLRAAGFVVVGRTTMTEAAFSGIGINPHHGTPRSPFDRATGRVPGGSSSGAAVSVADGMVPLGIGTDTGGSCRVPAAFCSVTGYKPTATSVPRDGAFPLSRTLDSIGSMAGDVDGCRVAHQVMAGLPLVAPPRVDLKGVRIAVPQTLLLDGLEPAVAAAFEQALKRLRDAGAAVVEIDLPVLADMPVINARGGIVTAEGYAEHRRLLERHGDLYDPRVRARLMRGADIDAADLIETYAARAAFRAGVEAGIAGFDAMAFPTAPMIPPPVAPLETDADLFVRTNMLILRNSTVINMIDGCGMSLPVHARGEPPVGLTLAATNGTDLRLLSLAKAAETALAA